MISDPNHGALRLGSQSQRAAPSALDWLARHQSPDGSWSLAGYSKMCKDATCTGTGSCTLSMTRAMSVTATFTLLPVLKHRLHGARKPDAIFDALIVNAGDVYDIVWCSDTSLHTITFVASNR